jgi:hypothetical protein
VRFVGPPAGLEPLESPCTNVVGFDLVSEKSKRPVALGHHNAQPPERLRFFYIGSIIFFIGILAVARFIGYYLAGSGAGHIQSLILSGALLTIGFQMWVLGILADLISINRKLSEEILYRMKRSENPPLEPGNRTMTRSLRNLLPPKKVRASTV